LAATLATLAFTANLSRAQEAGVGAPGDQLMEIVVTARKREESLEKTPIAISAYTAADLESRSLNNLSQISASTPSLSIAPSPQAANSNAYSVFMRGVGQLDFTLFTDPGVGIYIDGVYIARNIGAMLDFIDIQRVEVLRGPQGTLFGRNTIGGAISVITAPPSNEFAGSATLTAGSFERKQFQGNLNVPITDTLFAKLSGYAQYRNGYVDRIATGQDVGNDHTLAGRGELLWNIAPNFSAEFAADATRRDEHPGALVLLQASGFGFSTSGVRFTTPQKNPPTAFNRSLGGICLTDPDSTKACWGAAYVTGNPFTNNDTYGYQNLLNTEGGNLTLKLSEDYFTVKSITAYRSLYSVAPRDTDHSAFTFVQVNVTDKQNQSSQELQVAGTQIDDRLKWLLGLYYFRENGTEQIDTLNATSFHGVDNVLAINTNYAAFTEETFDVTKRLHLTAGVRWTHEEKQFSIYFPVTQAFSPTSPPVGGLVVGDGSLKKETFKKTTPLGTVSFDLADNWMTYATYSQGFKSGGFNGRYTIPVPAPIPFGPEDLTQYEIGLKYQAERVRVNLAAFHSKYSNIQINFRPNPAQILSVIGNAGAGKIDGVEAEATLVPIRNLRLEAGASYLDARYTQLAPSLALAGVTLSTPFVETPKWSGSVAGTYTVNLGGAGNLEPRIDYTYRTKVSLDNTNSLFIRQAGVGLLNANVGWSDPKNLWRVAFGGTNLTNKLYLVTGAFNGAAGTAEGLYGRPREWYVSARRSF
jgi:iron complex outermembrane receptor protein